MNINDLVCYYHNKCRLTAKLFIEVDICELMTKIGIYILLIMQMTLHSITMINSLTAMLFIIMDNYNCGPSLSIHDNMTY